MNIDIHATRLNDDDLLDELIFQSLDKIIGTPHRLISRSLPFNCGQAILALDRRQQPALIIGDRHDGNQALIRALKVLDALEQHRACIFRLYPELFGNDQHALRNDTIQLFLLAPRPPAGCQYLERMLTQVHILTFHALLLNGEPALLIESSSDEILPLTAADRPVKTDAFRGELPELEEAEENYFRNLNIMG